MPYHGRIGLVNPTHYWHSCVCGGLKYRQSALDLFQGHHFIAGTIDMHGIGHLGSDAGRTRTLQK